MPGRLFVKIGRQGDPASAISTANADTIMVRGHDLCKELIGAVSERKIV
jgi:citrate synthase